MREMCSFLPFRGLLEKVEGISKLGLASALKADFLEKAAEFFGVTTEEDEKEPVPYPKPSRSDT